MNTDKHRSRSLNRSHYQGTREYENEYENENDSVYPRYRAKPFINAFHAIRFAVYSESQNDRSIGPPVLRSLGEGGRNPR
jgi:hypothetical protein